MSDTFATLWTGSPPGSSVYGILQTRILEWIAIFFSCYQTQGWNLRLFNWKVDSLPLSHQGIYHWLVLSKKLNRFPCQVGSSWSLAGLPGHWLMALSCMLLQLSWRGVNPSTGWPHGRDCYPATKMQPLLSTVKTCHEETAVQLGTTTLSLLCIYLGSCD